jgi:hypothetical protein
VLKKYRWVHIILTEILLPNLMYWQYGPLAPDKLWLPRTPYYTFFYTSTTLNLEVGYLLVGASLIWSLVTLRRSWYESRILLYYELIVFVEFIVLIPLVSRMVWNI